MSNSDDDINKNWNSNSEGSEIVGEMTWNIHVSRFAKNTMHPLRSLFEQLKYLKNQSKPMIPLSVGDPTLLSDLEKPDIVKEIILKCVKNKENDAYSHSLGTDTAREAVAKYCSRPPQVIYKAQVDKMNKISIRVNFQKEMFKDIMLTHGCTQALDLIITVLANTGQNILIPKPGFSAYRTLSSTFGIQQRYYDLIAENDWSVDFESMVSQIDKKTVAIVVNNPSNPNGSVFSKDDLTGIINVAKRFRLPIIADEVFGDKDFYYMSELSDTVPIISCNSISKRFNMPGWRFGWLAIHDPQNYLAGIREGLFNLSTRIYAPNSLTQGIISELLEKTPKSYFERCIEILKTNAELFYERLSQLPGLNVKKPTASMYIMVGVDFKCFPDIKDDTDFVVKLVQKQSVFVFPCCGFGYPGYLRLAITIRKDKINEACERIADFVRDHYKEPPTKNLIRI